ncbi:pre-mRNA splicing factor [Artemisia annua]|uniref:Pre-mRNA splicing factor n=1 Tax=Artemisia annua TaxID=35608 RepID=A0A2U1KFI1_ARTAN|nr:pre-mRNA splicing factor [Artemisia annua]
MSLTNSDKQDVVFAVPQMGGYISNVITSWMQAATLEHDDVIKSKVLRKGLEHIPDSLRLWKAVVELANEEDAKLLLQRAVECCPLHVEFCLALTWLEKHDAAKQIREGVEIDQEAWMKEAKAAEWVGSVAICNAIIGNIVGIGDEKEDLGMSGMSKVRAVLTMARKRNPQNPELWLAAEAENNGKLDQARNLPNLAVDLAQMLEPNMAEKWQPISKSSREFASVDISQQSVAAVVQEEKYAEEKKHR